MIHKSHLLVAGCIGTVVACALSAVFLLVGIDGCHRDLRTSMKDFFQRHLEATDAIERTYRHFRQNGRWPAKADFEQSNKQWIPPGWEFEGDPEQGGPVIWLHGPCHMILSYRFAPPQHGLANNVWTLSVEGDKTTFQADIAYSFEPPPWER